MKAAFYAKHGADSSMKFANSGESLPGTRSCSPPSTPVRRSALTELLKGEQYGDPAKSDSDESAPWHVHLRGQLVDTLNCSRVVGDKCELLVNASKADTAESLLCKAEQQGLPANNFDVVFNGCKLGSCKPLVAYGVSKGSVLELVPVDTPAPAPDMLMPETPPLSSPHHALVRGLPLPVDPCELWCYCLPQCMGYQSPQMLA